MGWDVVSGCDILSLEVPFSKENLQFDRIRRVFCFVLLPFIIINYEYVCTRSGFLEILNLFILYLNVSIKIGHDGEVYKEAK